MNLQEFLNQNIVEGMTKEVVVSDRLKDENGELYKFKIKAMSSKEFDTIRNSCTKIKKSGAIELDDNKLNCQVLLSSVIYPNFKDVESLNKLGCVTPEQYIHKVLLAGEVYTLVKEIQNLSGIDKDIQELKEEVKN